jgi:Ala-tRNA(Pro) deacylase
MSQRLLRFLEEQEVAYELEEHPRAVTAQQLAAAEHVSGWDVAKTVLLSVGGQLAMVVVPAAVMVDLDRAADVLGHNVVRLAAEDEFEKVFEDCEGGAEPPFGNLYGVPVFLDEKLRARDHLVCRAGSHTKTLTLATEDYVRLVKPEIVDLSFPAG